MIHFSASDNKQQVFQRVQDFLNKQSMSVEEVNYNKPWGGYFVINQADNHKFINKLFPELSNFFASNKPDFSPKILIVSPEMRLSWQYHLRRAEIWKLIGGKAAVVYSDTDIEETRRILSAEETITLKQGERHRLVGLNTYGIIAEIWQHTDPSNLSNEEDIIRLQDDFGR